MNSSHLTKIYIFEMYVKNNHTHTIIIHPLPTVVILSWDCWNNLRSVFRRQSRNWLKFVLVATKGEEEDGSSHPLDSILALPVLPSTGEIPPRRLYLPMGVQQGPHLRLPAGASPPGATAYYTKQIMNAIPAFIRLFLFGLPFDYNMIYSVSFFESFISLTTITSEPALGFNWW